jgi:hypothetical protein
LAHPRDTRSGLRSGLRSRSDAEAALRFEDNPESLLRKHRVTQKSLRAAQAEADSESIQHTSPYIFSRTIHTLFANEAGQNTSSFSDEGSAEASDTEEQFNRKWGYLPELDEEAIAVIEAIIANPEMANDFKRINPEHKDFPWGLLDRNVIIEESPDIDPQSNHVSLLTSGVLVETEGEMDSHDHLWASDQAKCNQGSNEALFQRTLMMGLIARHRLIYARDSAAQGLLDFSVEESWCCPPMPTRAYWKGESFLTQPRPDLAVCFIRKALVPDNIWNYMPKATKRLACYEGADEIKAERVFHFFTIEAKKGQTPISDTVGKRQSLNNASQALHNMFEFFKEAGPRHEEIFFEKVRFFSVVASTEGMVIRTHRATRVHEGGLDEDPIIPEYPLRFEYKEFCTIPKDKFERKIILENFERILHGYGVKELHLLLRKAAEDVVRKLKDDASGMSLRGNPTFYRYDQIIIPTSKRPTPAASQAPSIENDALFGSFQDGPLVEAPQLGTNISFDMSRTGINTPRKSIGQMSSPLSSGKRSRENNGSSRRIRQRNQS